MTMAPNSVHALLTSYGFMLDSHGHVKYEEVIKNMRYMPPDAESVGGRLISTEAGVGTWHLQDHMPSLKVSAGKLKKLDDIASVVSSASKNAARLNAKTVLLSKQTSKQQDLNPYSSPRGEAQDLAPVFEKHLTATLDDRASIYSKKSMKTYQSSNLGALQNHRRRNNETASAVPSNATPYQNSVVNDRKTISAHKDDNSVFDEPPFRKTKVQREEQRRGMTICGITKRRGVHQNPIASPRGVAVSEIYK